MNPEALARAANSIATSTLLAEDALLLYKIGNRAPVSEDLLKKVIEYGRESLRDLAIGLGCEDEDVADCEIMLHFFAAQPTEERSRRWVDLMLEGGEREFE